jgi:hypothetical protein
MILGEGGREAGMKGGVASCPIARRCPWGAPGRACSPTLLRTPKNCWMKINFCFLSTHVQSHPNVTECRPWCFWVNVSVRILDFK